MNLRNLGRPRRRLFAVTLLILALTATAAVAATISGDGTLIGTPQNDTIAAGNSNDTAYGLAGADTISAGSGNDVIDGDGKCLPGATAANAASYCQHGPQKGDGGDRISTGNGNDVVYTGGGPNTVSVGSADDTIEGYGGPNTISAGNGTDKIYDNQSTTDVPHVSGGSISVGSGGKSTNPGLIYGSPANESISTGSMSYDKIYLGSGGGNTVNVGGSGIVYAQNGNKDTISCASSGVTTVYADKGIDVLRGCRTVIYTRAAGDVRHAAASRLHRKAVTHKQAVTRRTRSGRRTRAHHA